MRTFYAVLLTYTHTQQTGGGAIALQRNITVHSNSANVTHVLSPGGGDVMPSQLLQSADDWYTYVPPQVDYIYSPVCFLFGCFYYVTNYALSVFLYVFAHLVAFILLIIAYCM